MIREPVFAGRFYPADPDLLREEVERFLTAGRATAAPPDDRTLAVIAPHAGYMYSGGVAGAVFAAARLPRTLVILCPNHTGRGRPVAVMRRGSWATPIGPVPVDGDLADGILRSSPQAEEDDRAHEHEHSLEVQLPFLQLSLGEFSFVPVCVGTQREETLEGLGRGIHRALGDLGRPAGLVVSSDMSHYIPAGEARAKDMEAIERITALDPAGLHRVVRDHDISMCGYAPAVAGLTAAVAAGASRGRLVAYANSGDVTGDYAEVVGYAGMTIS